MYVYTVKRICTIFFLTIYLFSATDSKEFFKLNVVIEHLHEHQRDDKSVSLLSFLIMHYVTDDSNQKDDDRDRSLPFKSADSHVATNSFVSIPFNFIQCNFHFFIVNENDFLIVKTFFVLMDFYASIWHPPQLS